MQDILIEEERKPAAKHVRKNIVVKVDKKNQKPNNPRKMKGKNVTHIQYPSKCPAILFSET